MDDIKLKLHMRLQIFHKDPYFGPGMARLMGLVKEKDSLTAACQEMGMAYSKAWKIIKRAESDLGFELISGRRGGKNGGISSLTKEGEDFLTRYLAFEQESQKQVTELFHKYYSD